MAAVSRALRLHWCELMAQVDAADAGVGPETRRELLELLARPLAQFVHPATEYAAVLGGRFTAAELAAAAAIGAQPMDP